MKVFSTHEILQETRARLQKVQAERDALVLQNYAFKNQLLIAHTALNNADETGYIDGLGFVDFDAIADDIECTTQMTAKKYLAEIRAEAGRAGYQLGAGQWCFNQDEVQIDIERSAEEYADKIRQGGAE